jgi:hypothetical protein
MNTYTITFSPVGTPVEAASFSDRPQEFQAGQIEVSAEEFARWATLRRLADGSLVDDATLAPAAPAPLIELSRMQLLVGLWRDGRITAAEAETWTRLAALPEALEAVLATLDEAASTEARLRALGFVRVRSDEPLVAVLAAALGMDAAGIADALQRYSEI